VRIPAPYKMDSRLLKVSFNMPGLLKKFLSNNKLSALMTHIVVTWHHQHPDEPVELFSELDDERFEVRKVEVSRQ
jgi:hypothetical protein